MDLSRDFHPVNRVAKTVSRIITAAASRPQVITRKGYPAAVVISPEHYHRLCELASAAARPALTTDELTDAIRGA